MMKYVKIEDRMVIRYDLSAGILSRIAEPSDDLSEQNDSQEKTKTH